MADWHHITEIDAHMLAVLSNEGWLVAVVAFMTLLLAVIGV